MQTVVSEQKFIIQPDGTIIVEWVNPDFSDVIIDALYSEKEKEEIYKLSKKTKLKPKIWCG